jgi:hypothetical protein
VGDNVPCVLGCDGVDNDGEGDDLDEAESPVQFCPKDRDCANFLSEVISSRLVGIKIYNPSQWPCGVALTRAVP